MPDNSKIEVEVGDSDGEQRTYHKYNISEVDMKQFLTAEIEQLKYDGYHGTITTSGQPFVRHGDAVEIKDEQLSRSGTYLIKKVSFAVSVPGGYRRTLTLDRAK
jgi:alpha-acetolactate decarboxylase